jgi:TonB family protein
MRVLLNTCLVLLAAVIPAWAQSPRPEPALRIAVLSFGSTTIAESARTRLGAAMAASPGVAMVDGDLAQVAAAGAGYEGSLNLTRQEAEDLGSAIDCDFYLIGDVQTLRRSPSTGPAFLESYATIFIVSARTGRLIHWDRVTRTGPTAAESEKGLLSELEKQTASYVSSARAADAVERAARFAAIGHDLPVIEETPADDSAAANGFRPPAPYRRISPVYTPAANAAEVIATVDAQVDLDLQGEVKDIQIARWAGFGLDESVTSAIKQMHFRPAMRNGVAFPIRVLLRYNFRKPK